MSGGAEGMLLTARDMAAEYGSRRVLSGISLGIARGQVISLIGPNGSGKSTLLRALAGIQSLVAGEVLLGARPSRGLSPAERAREVAYVGADLRCEFPLAARDAVAMGLFAHGRSWGAGLSPGDRDRVAASMERAGCAELASRSLNSLSGGERQRVALARALVQGSAVLLLDEALGRMDLHHQARAGRLLRDLAAQGAAVVLVSHDLQMAAEWSTHAMLLKDGELRAFGEAREVITAKSLESLYPGATFLEVPDPRGGFPIVLPRHS